MRQRPLNTGCNPLGGRSLSMGVPMTITFRCDGCNTKVRVKDEFAGRKARCPSCRALVVVPHAESEPADEPVELEEASPPPPPSRRKERDRPTKPKKKRKAQRSWITTPFVNVLGIDFNALRLLIVVLVLGAGFTGLFFMARRAGKVIVEVKRVDAWAAITGISHKIQGTAHLIVTRDDSAGKFILIRFKMPSRVFEKHFADQKGLTALDAATIQLQSGSGDLSRCVFLVSTAQEGGYTVDPHHHGKNILTGIRSDTLFECLGPAPDSPWITEGVWQSQGELPSRFLATSGMEVQFTASTPKPAEVEVPPGTSAEEKKLLEGLSVGVHVNWDEKSTASLGVDAMDEPSSRFLTGWEITCLFPAPRTTDQLRLVVLEASYPVTLP